MAEKLWFPISLLLATVAVITAGACFAATTNVDELWRTGQYAQAISAGMSSNSSQDLSTAARAAVSDMMLRAPSCADCIARADRIARKAIATAPNDALNHVYLALALGYRARTIGLSQSRREGIAEAVKHELETAIGLDKKNPLAIATLGGWNFDVVRIGGSLLARWTYGATLEAGMAEFQQSIALLPDHSVLHYQYALELASIDPEKYERLIADQLSRAAVAEADSEYEMTLRKRAKVLLDIQKSGNKIAFADRVREFMGIPD